MSQLIATVSEMKKETGRLPSQTVQNLRGNVSAVTLRSGKKLVDELEGHEEGECSKDNEEDRTGLDQAPTDGLDPTDELKTSDTSQALRTPGSVASPTHGLVPDASQTPSSVPIPLASGPTSVPSDGLRPSAAHQAPATSRLASAPEPETEDSRISAPLPFSIPARTPKRYVMDKDVWELFSQVEINIPLLEAIKQIPRYAKFLKELCTNRRRGTCVDQELMSRNVSAVIQRTVPPKCCDPGTYTIPCTIGNIRIENCMLDLGASINVLPYSIYSSLRIGPLEPAGLTIQLADRSFKQLEGKIEDVLVQVGELVFPADFYVLKMENCGPNDHAPILLGRPFLKTSKMKIDCGS
ncbi:unnamed protein product [Rhodiola kirilowii]